LAEVAANARLATAGETLSYTTTQEEFTSSSEGHHTNQRQIFTHSLQQHKPVSSQGAKDEEPLKSADEDGNDGQK
jgi:hypothetical protein